MNFACGNGYTDPYVCDMCPFESMTLYSITLHIEVHKYKHKCKRCFVEVPNETTHVCNLRPYEYVILKGKERIIMSPYTQK